MEGGAGTSGTDLLLYLSIITGSYAIFLIYLRTRRLEQKLTEHVRLTSIQNAIPPGKVEP